MKVKLLSFTFLLIALPWGGRAQGRSLPQRFPPISGESKITMMAAQTYSVPADTFARYINDGFNAMLWRLWGDIEFADGSGAASKRVESVADFTISVRSKAGKYGKGRIQFYCGDDDERWPCNPATSIDIYKDFTPGQSFTIAGVGCFKSGDTLVYSVDPVLTTNINSCIGFDNYAWRFPNDLFEVLYTSGDSSAYTFRAKREATLADDLYVWFGRMNVGDSAKALHMPLRAKAPLPTLNGGVRHNSTLCMVNGQSSTFTVDDADTVRYIYKWRTVDNVVTDNGDMGASVNVKCNGAGSLFLSVIDKHSDSDCSTTEFVLNIRPSLDGVKMRNDTKCSGTDVNVVLDYPKTDVLVWSSPNADIDLGSGNPRVTPRRGASYITMVAEVPVCDATTGVVSRVEGNFYLPSRDVAVNAYTTAGNKSNCFSVGDTVTFRAEVVSGEPQVDGTVYEWSRVDGWNYLAVEGNEATVVVGASPSLVQSVSYSSTLSECEEEKSASRQISFYTATPTITTPRQCLDVHFVNSVMLSVEQQPGVQSYYWTFAPGLSNSSQTDATTAQNSLSLINGGVPGEYVYTVTPVASVDGGGCGVGEIVASDTVVVPQLPDGVAVLASSVSRGTKYSFKYYVNGVQLTPVAWVTSDVNGDMEVATTQGKSVDILDYDDETEEDIPLSGTVTCVFLFTSDGCEHYASLSKAYNGSEIRDTVIVLDLDDVLGNANKSLAVASVEDEFSANVSFGGVAPNPASDKLNVSLDPMYASEVVLTSVGGSPLIRSTSVEGRASIQLSVSDIPNGLYVVTVRQNGHVSSCRVVVKHG